jgi:hypothetical protein
VGVARDGAEALEERLGAAAVFGWGRPLATCVHGVEAPRLYREDALDADLVLPVIVEIVLVAEALPHAELKSGQVYRMGIIGKGHPPAVSPLRLVPPPRTVRDRHPSAPQARQCSDWGTVQG